MNINAESKINWWKPAFFVALIAFEFTREIAVISGAAPAQPISSTMIFAVDGFVQAQGTWRRIDGGEKLVPGTVTIQCEQETGQCIEATTMINERYVFAPDVSKFQATFTPGSVSYDNTNASCADYSVRIDLQLKKAFAVRSRKGNGKGTACSKLEPRIEMQLTDGNRIGVDPTHDHFVPLLSILRAVIG